MEDLPDDWMDVQPNVIYQTVNGLLVSFAYEQIKLGVKYDQNGKHLKAIEKGKIPPRGGIGLVVSQEEGYVMTQLVLQNHPVWHDLTEILESLDGDSLVKEHLDECNYKVCGYWDDRDRYYEEVALPNDLVSELVGSSVEVNHRKRFLKLRFVLTAGAGLQTSDFQKIGELLLVYNESLEFIDENWHLEIESPLLKVIQG
jgi:hypothetical protein